VLLLVKTFLRRALAYFSRIEPELHRFPAIDAPAYRRAVEEMFWTP
jgi:hypothetical protein